MHNDTMEFFSNSIQDTEFCCKETKIVSSLVIEIPFDQELTLVFLSTRITALEYFDNADEQLFSTH
jgi:hypothetical protein